MGIMNCMILMEVVGRVKVFKETLLLERAMVKSQLGDQVQYNEII
jgi:hypothetical protein